MTGKETRLFRNDFSHVDIPGSRISQPSLVVAYLSVVVKQGISQPSSGYTLVLVEGELGVDGIHLVVEYVSLVVQYL